MLAMQFCGEILQDEEDEIQQADLEEIASLLIELESLAANPDQIPERHRKLIENQVGQIKAPIATYKIAGAKVLREAVRSSYGELAEAKKHHYRIQAFTGIFQARGDLAKSQHHFRWCAENLWRSSAWSGGVALH